MLQSIDTWLFPTDAPVDSVDDRVDAFDVEVAGRLVVEEEQGLYTNFIVSHSDIE